MVTQGRSHTPEKQDTRTSKPVLEPPRATRQRNATTRSQDTIGSAQVDQHTSHHNNARHQLCAHAGN